MDVHAVKEEIFSILNSHTKYLKLHFVGKTKRKWNHRKASFNNIQMNKYYIFIDIFHIGQERDESMYMYSLI